MLLNNSSASKTKGFLKNNTEGAIAAIKLSLATLF